MKRSIIRKIAKPVLFFVIIAFLCVSMGGAVVFAEETEDAQQGIGWFDENSDEYKALYGDNAIIGDEAEIDDSWLDNILDVVLGGFFSSINILEELLSGLIAGLAWGIDSMLQAAPTDLSIEGIVYGRMSDSEMRMDLVHFGVEKNNPWGLFGAALYYNIRKLCFMVIPVVLMVMLIIQLIRNTQKGRAQLKDLVKRTAIFFLLCYATPYIVEGYIYLRDVCMHFMGDGLDSILREIAPAEAGIDIGIEDIFNGNLIDILKADKDIDIEDILSGDLIDIVVRKIMLGGNGIGSGEIFKMTAYAYRASGAFGDALMMLATSLAGLFFLFDYVKISMLISVVFGFSPLLFIIYLWNPKILEGWSNIMFPALLTPFVDMVLLKLPAFISIIYTSIYGFDELLGFLGFGSRKGGSILCFILIICIWNSKIVRDRFIKLLGFEGFPKGNGMGMLAMMFMRLASKGKGSSPEGPQPPGVTPDFKNADKAAKLGTVLERADKDVEDIISPSKSETFGDSPAETSSKTDDFLESMNSQEEQLQDEPVGYDMGTDETAVPDSVMEERISADGMERVVGDAQAAEMVDSDAMPEVVVNDDSVLPSTENAVPHAEVDFSSKSHTVSVPEPVSLMGDSTKFKDAISGLGDIEKQGLTEEKAFNDSLVTRDQHRYANLRQLDALRDRVKANEVVMERAGYSQSGFAESYRAEQSRNDKLDHHVNRLQTQVETLKSQGADYSAYQKDLATAQSAKQLSDARLKDMSNASVAARENAFYQKHIDYCKEVESRYAQNAANVGMNSRTYDSADAFRNYKQVEQIHKEHINFRNFDSARYDGILTPQEKEAYYRQRAGYQLAKVAASATLVPAAAAVGAFALGYGGAGASASGAYVMGDLASNAAASIAYRGVNAVNEIETRKQAPKQPTKVSSHGTYRKYANDGEQSVKNALKEEQQMQETFKGYADAYAKNRK